jgi:cytochrome c peroxidase
MPRSATRGAVLLVLTLLIFTLVASSASAKPPRVTLIEQLGAAIAFDENLSEPAGQACATCHDPKAGYGDPDKRFPVSEGVVPGLFGGRNAPSWAYTAWSPILSYDVDDEAWVGGMFWDGRATGWMLGLPLAEQAQGPFLNPVEMANTTKDQVIGDIRTSWYADLFRQQFGDDSLDDVDDAYDDMAFAIAAYESSYAVNPFSSRYDAWVAGNEGAFSEEEVRGFELFNGKAKCNLCHISEPVEADYALFTDYTYDNLGIPANPEVWDLHGSDAVDLGLGGFLAAQPLYADAAADENGKFKVPTLRNVARSAPYGHNGYFRSLYDIVHFYNTRDVPEAMWPAPEVPENVNTDELGDLHLSYHEELAVVAFMKALTDRSVLPQPAR